jgi:hypothetical protein
MIDKGKLADYLAESLRVFKTLDGHMEDPLKGARVQGAIMALSQVQHELEEGGFECAVPSVTGS